MKDKLRQITVILLALATIVVNVLANALPFNGKNTGEISDNFQVFFVPAGYVFAIWGLIYIGLITYAVYQALPSQRENPRLRGTFGYFTLASLANIFWLFFWHYEQFLGTLAVMLVLLASLIAIYLRLGIGQVKVSPAENWLVRIPFSIYLGWITVATVANVTDVLDFYNWNAFNINPQIWMVIILAAVLVIAGLVSLTRRDVAYNLVVLWALAGIAVKHAAVSLVASATWVTFGLVAVVMITSLFLRKKAT